MISDSEIIRLGKLLEREYANEIKPMLENVKETIDKILAPCRSPEYKEMAARHNSDGIISFYYIPESLRSFFWDLGFSGDENNHGNLYMYPIQKDARSIYRFDVHSTEVRASDSMDIEEAIRDTIFDKKNRLYALQRIKDMKTDFVKKREAYEHLFVEDGGKGIKLFSDAIQGIYNRMLDNDRKQDEELYKMFGEQPKVHHVKFNLVVEEE